jgi:hypothetical protein
VAVVALLDQGGDRPHLGLLVGSLPELRSQPRQDRSAALEAVCAVVAVVEGLTGDEAVGTAENLAGGWSGS